MNLWQIIAPQIHRLSQIDFLRTHIISIYHTGLKIILCWGHFQKIVSGHQYAGGDK
jgi:hypothetical protein